MSSTFSNLEKFLAFAEEKQEGYMIIGYFYLAQKEAFQEAWERFLNNFKSGMFLDSIQKLIYSSYTRKKEY